LTGARRAARVDTVGELLTLDEQYRSGWNPALIAEGHALVRACVQTNRPGPYQIQAAVNAVHTSSPDPVFRRRRHPHRGRRGGVPGLLS